jgi:hypothetical protein
MSGGIFVNRPFAFNLKCIVFGFALVMGYWAAATAPQVNFWLFPLIFVLGYVAMAWYDELYNCSDRLRSGRYGVVSVADTIFKPQLRGISDSADDQEYLHKRNLYMFHSFIAMPLIMYVTYGRGGAATLAFGLALLGFVYHLFSLFTLWSSTKT